MLRLARSPIEAELISERDEMLEKSRIANTRAADIDSIQQTERDLQASRTALQRRLEGYTRLTPLPESQE